jgi:hypothetical protein
MQDMVGVLYHCDSYAPNKFLAHFRKLLFYDCTLWLFVWVPNFVGRSRKGRCNLLCHFRSHNYIFCIHRFEYLVYNLLMFSPYCLNVPRTSCCMAFHSAKKDLQTCFFDSWGYYMQSSKQRLVRYWSTQYSPYSLNYKYLRWNGAKFHTKWHALALCRRKNSSWFAI